MRDSPPIRVRYPRSLDIPSFRNQYDWSKSFLRLYFFYRKKIFSKAVLRFDPTQDNWKPENHPVFSFILILSEIGLEHNISPKEYLAALIFGRQVLSRKLQALEFFSFEEEDLVSEDAVRSIDNYLLIRESYSGYQLPTLGDIQDPEEIRMKQDEMEDQTWILIRESSKSDEEALIKILSSDVKRMFRLEFFENFPEFTGLVQQRRVVVDSEGYINWIS